jgi:hydrogenase expression/formation protein
MDVEGYVRRNMRNGRPEAEIIRNLSSRIREIKPVSQEYAETFAHAVITEVKNTSNLTSDLLTCTEAGVGMGEFGVGSRGTGDFYAHRKIAEIIGKTGANVGVDEMDDAGVVEAGGRYIISTVDGMHSRLSDFPFLAGFHVTRATLRDCYVMGARPVMLFSDIHVADDGDVSKIFDYTAGITTVGEVMHVPLVSGSTLRIGGDMVIGERLTGCVGCVGVADHITARREAKPGDILLMTEGAGGGTIATTALYYGFPEIVDRTINLQFLKGAEALLRSEVLPRIHAMTDVTNGGLRGDIFEMAETAKARFIVEEEQVLGLVDPIVRKMLEELKIDPLGVSIDAMLIVAPKEAIGDIRRVLEDAGVRTAEIGRVESGPAEPVLIRDGKETEFRPKFREAAYTPLKKLVDKESRNFEEMQTAVDRAADAALAKKKRMIERIGRIN